LDKGRDTPDSSGAPPEAPRPAAEPPSAPVVSLQAALRRARLENAERSDVVADLRSAEGARLDLLRERIAPIVAEAQRHSDMFDLALASGDPPRLFVDMLGFVEMARDRRVYRFVQDTRHGRVLIVESESPDVLARAVADYCARRLIEREKALAADALFGLPPDTAPRPPASKPQAAFAVASAPAEDVVAPARGLDATRALAPRRRPGALRVFARAFLFVVELLGSVVFFGALAAGGWWAWATYLR
jgi:hypothetical protein